MINIFKVGNRYKNENITKKVQKPSWKAVNQFLFVNFGQFPSHGSGSATSIPTRIRVQNRTAKSTRIRIHNTGLKYNVQGQVQKKVNRSRKDWNLRLLLRWESKQYVGIVSEIKLKKGFISRQVYISYIRRQVCYSWMTKKCFVCQAGYKNTHCNEKVKNKAQFYSC